MGQIADVLKRDSPSDLLSLWLSLVDRWRRFWPVGPLELMVVVRFDVVRSLGFRRLEVFWQVGVGENWLRLVWVEMVDLWRLLVVIVVVRRVRSRVRVRVRVRVWYDVREVFAL